MHGARYFNIKRTPCRGPSTSTLQAMLGGCQQSVVLPWSGESFPGPGTSLHSQSPEGMKSKGHLLAFGRFWNNHTNTITCSFTNCSRDLLGYELSTVSQWERINTLKITDVSRQEKLLCLSLGNPFINILSEASAFGI